MLCLSTKHTYRTHTNRDVNTCSASLIWNVDHQFGLVCLPSVVLRSLAVSVTVSLLLGGVSAKHLSGYPAEGTSGGRRSPSGGWVIRCHWGNDLRGIRNAVNVFETKKKRGGVTIKITGYTRDVIRRDMHCVQTR